MSWQLLVCSGSIATNVMQLCAAIRKGLLNCGIAGHEAQRAAANRQGGIINDLFPKWKQLMKKQQTINKQQNPRLAVRCCYSPFSLFSTGFIQVYFVAVNTYFIANEMYLGVLIAAFMISLIWSFNVKKVAFGSTTDRVVYALGATCGSIVGLWSSSFIASILNGL